MLDLHKKIKYMKANNDNDRFGAAIQHNAHVYGVFKRYYTREAA